MGDWLKLTGGTQSGPNGVESRHSISGTSPNIGFPAPGNDAVMSARQRLSRSYRSILCLKVLRPEHRLQLAIVVEIERHNDNQLRQLLFGGCRSAHASARLPGAAATSVGIQVRRFERPFR